MAEKSNRALIATTAVAASAGLFATWKLYKDWQKIQVEKERNLPDHASEIDPKDLAILATSSNFALKKSAEQILLDRMMTGEHLEFLLKQCTSSNQTEMKKAIAVLSLMSKSREFKQMLVKNNIFEVISKSINMMSDGFRMEKLALRCYVDYEVQKTLQLCIVTLLDLVADSEGKLKKFFKTCKELVAFLLELICDPSDSISSDVRRLSILILQHMIQHEQMRCNLISYGMIQRISLCFLRTLGDPWISRNCLQILVMQINLFEDYVTEEFLQEMAQLGIIPVLIGCLKSEDPDLIYWSTALIHEFLLKDLHRGVIAKIPNLVKTLYHILISSESSLQRLILRIYCFLSINDDNFKKRLLNFKPLMKRMSICLASGNNDLLYWSLLLVHDLAMMGKIAALKMMKANEDLLKSIITLTQASVDGPCDVKLVAETLGFFCSCESLHKKVVEAGCVKVILQLLKSDNTELQFWASSLLLNLAMSSDDARGRVIKDGGISMLLEMAVKESEMPQITAQASKILVMLGFTDAKLQIDLKSGLDANIRIDGKEHSPIKHGINMVIVDFLNFKISKGKAFDLENPVDAVNLLAELKNHRQNELLLLTTQGKVNSFITEVQSTNIFFALEEFGLKSKLLEDDGSWCIIAQAKRNSPAMPIAAKQGPNNVDLTIAISLAAQVNSFVEDDLLKPLLNILMSTPAGSSISKVPELEILSTLARHGEHQKVMLSTAGLLEYLSELIWCFACLETDQLSTKPLMIAHCIGAMKICHSLSTNSAYRDKLFHGPVLGAIKSFLITNCNVLLLNLKAKAEYAERTASRYYQISSADDVFIGSETPRNDSEAGSKFGVYAEWSQNAMAGRTESDVSRNLDSVGNAETLDTRKRTSFYEPKHSEVQDDRSDLISPFCRDPKARGDEIEALIAQVTFEKTFNKDRDDLSADERNEFRQKIREISKEDAEATAGPSTNPERETLAFTFEEETRDSGAARSARNRDSRLSERSKGSSAAKRSESELGRRFDDDYHENFEYDEFEEEDLPPILDNDDDELYFSQGRGFFDVTRMASAQRMRSSSAFNPNDWPTTRSGCLSRTLSEAAQRAKSPLKDIASDLEDFDEAVVNLTNYALMTVYFAVYGRRFEDLKNKNDVSKLVHILWCVLLSCKQENRVQIGVVVSSIINHLCTASSEEKIELHQQSNVLLNAKAMTSSMIISNDLLEIYNGNWTFESISATEFVSRSSYRDQQPLGWCYEVTLLSKGIMQIGWASDSSKFEPEKGLGVGDSVSSVGFDGSRCKLWNGQGVFDDEADNSYGRKWALGDTITCLLSINGDVSFQLNGQDLGIELKGLDTNLNWYPAISLSLDQQCRVNFGKEPFIFEIPVGYLSIEQATKPLISTNKSTSLTSSSSVSDSKNEIPEVNLKDVNKDIASPRNIDSRRSYSKSPAVFDRRTPSSREMFKYRYRSGLDFSPKDLLGSNGSIDISEVLYYEVMCSNANEFEIGYQSTTRTCKSTCRIKGHSVCISTQSGDKKSAEETIQFEETIGCGLLWPLKKIFFTVDGVGTQFSTDLVESEEQWTENLDEIIPYFSRDRLRVNFGQNLFCSQAMNLSTYRRNCTQLMYDVILASEESL